VLLLKSMTAMLASLAGLLLASPVSPPRSNSPVSEAEWKAMLARHANGGVIELGHRRVAFVRQQFQPRGQVTIRGGVFGPVVLDHWRNVVFDGSEFVGAPGTPRFQSLIDAYAPERLVIRNCHFTGYKGEDGALSVRGPMIRSGEDVTIERSTFEDMVGNLGFVRSNRVRFRDNELRRIREGVQIVGGDDIVIEHNRFEDFQPAPGDHPDAIQIFMTGLKPNEPGVQDLTIRGNLIVAEGKAQAIFATGGGDRLGTATGYARFTIENNVIVGAAWHGITAVNVAGLTVRGNRLYRIADVDKYDSRLTAAGMDVVVQDNEANAFILKDDVKQARNRKVGPSKAARIDAVIAEWTAQNRPK
jgi:hypothetical protein